jgi:hypothetical protein
MREDTPLTDGDEGGGVMVGISVRELISELEELAKELGDDTEVVVFDDEREEASPTISASANPFPKIRIL